ncbi:Cu(I)-responsive transcriptional regulator [Vibrio scophthalmi]|uniref:HTH-type transcriptional regulator CueR n=2 Tax=Vibrio scophthalmi TaxID=45658 RepID=A0A1C7FF54_9VIBR|nr:Cu(I)-responsive transcriptional regulator [Vibrio scophthalmi]ANU38337.1 HTH-type transcriptional regulator CueR [Vibrio scophthalmi]MCY9803420.1 Cu(I)-responsive transcriptional regulator [Vibrio scophthalmi]ODS04650.1 HTH-type transcriptional regulator CueR [Vibrio scophthalmi]
MNIGEVAQMTGLSSKSIRLYEEKGIISAPHRSASGYREYSSQHLQELNLVSRAKNAGFSLIECKEFVQLAHNPERKSSEVKARAQIKLDEVQLKIKQLQEIERQLKQWVSSCPGNSHSQCPIIDDLTKS